MASSIAVGIDLGATRIKGGLVDLAAGGVLVGEVVTAPTGEDRSGARVLSRLLDVVATLRARGLTVCGVGVGACGTIDPEAGRVIDATETMPGWKGTALGPALREATGLPCRCDNDGNAAAVGEAVFGSGKDDPRRPLVLLTLGTGVGGGIVLDGPDGPFALQGASFRGGHLGHIKVRARGLPDRQCACGATGCLEAHASAFALRQHGWPDAADVFADAGKGDARAQALVDEAATALGAAFADLGASINPHRIAIAGGIARSWHQLAPRALRVFGELAFEGVHRHTVVERATLDEPGVIGAAYLVARAT